MTTFPAPSLLLRRVDLKNRQSGCLNSDNIVTTMKAAHVTIRQIGNSLGVVIPKPILMQLGLDAKAEAKMSIEGDTLVLRRLTEPARKGWAEASRKIADAGDDALVMGEFGNSEDKNLDW